MANFTFNVADNKATLPAKQFDLLPTDEYIVTVREGQFSMTKAGEKLTIVLKVQHGPFKNRQVWTPFFLEHPNTDTRLRSCAAFCDLCFAVGITGQLYGLSDLYDKPLMARIYTTQASKAYAARNAASGFKKLPDGYLASLAALDNAPSDVQVPTAQVDQAAPVLTKSQAVAKEVMNRVHANRLSGEVNR